MICSSTTDEGNVAFPLVSFLPSIEYLNPVNSAGSVMFMKVPVPALPFMFPELPFMFPEASRS